MVAAPNIHLKSLSLKLLEIGIAREALLAQIADLDAASTAVKAEYNSILNNASAVAVLPNEILASIFEKAQRNDDGLALLVTKVTSRWRGVAINSPRLWSKIYITNQGPGVKLAALYLIRSKAIPFELKVVVDRFYKDSAALGQFLIDHIHRCRRLTIDFGSSESHQANQLLDSLAPLSCPLLKSINISCDYVSSEHRVGRLFVGGAPMLATVRLSAYPCSGFLPPLECVTSLHLLDIIPNSQFTSETLRDALLSIKCLILLEVKGEIVTSWMPVGAIELPALQILRIHATDEQIVADQIRGIYGAIDAPSLKTLVLANVYDIDLQFLDSLETKKFPALDTLTLSGFGGLQLHSGLGPLMRTFPDVHTIAILGDNPAAYELLGLLQKIEAAGVYCPRLRRLDLPTLRSFNRHDNFNLMYDCLTSRINMGHPIEILALCNDAVAQMLQGTLDDGLPYPMPRMDLVQVVEYEKEDEP